MYFRSPILCRLFRGCRTWDLDTLNRTGERGSPCFTPWLILICLVSPFAVAKVVVAPSYRFSTTLINWVGTPSLTSPFANRSCKMVSKAFARSRNATARVPFSFFCFHIRCSSRTEFCLTPGAGMKPLCEGWRPFCQYLLVQSQEYAAD